MNVHAVMHNHGKCLLGHAFPPPREGESYPQDSSKRIDIADPHTTPTLHPLLEAHATLPMLLVQYSDQT